MQFYSADGESPWANIGYVCLFAIFYGILTLLALTFKKLSSR